LNATETEIDVNVVAFSKTKGIARKRQAK